MLLMNGLVIMIVGMGMTFLFLYLMVCLVYYTGTLIAGWEKRQEGIKEIAAMSDGVKDKE